MASPAGLKKNLSIIVLALSLFSLNITVAATIFDSDIEVLRSDNSGILFRYDVPDASFSQFKDSGQPYYRMNIPRAAPNGREAEVEIPIRIVALAIPPQARVQISVNDAQYESAPFQRIAPYFARPDADALKDAYQSAAAENPILPPTQPYLLSMGEIRGLQVARIAIPTAIYSLNPPELKILKNVTIRVDFVGARPELAAGFRDPGPVYNRILRKTVANYDAAGGWFWPRPSSQIGAELAAVPFDSAATWIRIELTSEGIYSFGWLQFNSVGISPLNVDPSQIRIFYGGGRELPVPNSQPRPDFAEIPIEVMGGDDGTFDNGDLVVFYADAVDSWEYNTQFHRFQSYRNHYTDKNVYWLTFDGGFSSPPKRFIAGDGSPDGPVDISVDTYTAYAHKEQEQVFWQRNIREDFFDYFNWYWGKGQTFSTSVQLSDLVAGSEATITVRHQFGSPSLIINGGAPISPQTYQIFSTYHSSAMTEGINNLQLQSPSDLFLDYVDVEYPRWLRVIDGNLAFIQPDTFGAIRYNLTDVPVSYFLLDVTNKRNPVKIINGNLNGSNLAFDDTASGQSHKQYYLSGRERFKTPGAVSLYQQDNLRDVNRAENRADEIIVTYDGFYDQAVRLAQHRQQAYGLTTRVAKLTDIYNQFSAGLTDGIAIRDFLKYAYENWPDPAPSYALLVGDGNYDFRNNLGSNVRSYMPPFENTQRMTDEYYVYFGNEGYLDSDADSLPDMLIGRLSVRSSQEADEVVSKLIDYDSNPDLGPWRDRVVVVADDNLHPPYPPSERYHTDQAEGLANGHIPSKFEQAKIYMIEYPMRTGFEKPEARDAIMAAFNQGSLIINWIGHGSANVWADERVFRRVEDIPRLANGKRLPLVFTASCSIGRFDTPTIECMAEELLRGRSKGSISVISATREVFAAPNAVLNEFLFDQMLRNDSTTIGEALFMAKYIRTGGRQTDINDRFYMIFGDPAQLLQFPKYDVRLSIAPDSLVALTVDSLAGEIVNNNGEIQSDFNGTIWVTVKDGSSIRNVTLYDMNNVPLPGTLGYRALGATIFIGPAEVSAGHFTSRFFVPKDISYGSQGAKIYAYGENGIIDAIGVKDSISISGSLPSLQDSIGPTIRLLVDGRPFGAGITMVPESFMLGAEITDEHGINITGNLGHGIVVSIDGGQAYEGDITSYFRYNMGDYRSGAASFRLPELSTGEHELTIKAWDNFNNSTLATARIEVAASGSLQISQVMNYPNPVRESQPNTAFQYCLSEDVEKVTIKIFTEAGHRIKTIEFTSPEYTSMDCHQAPWDLRDADSDELANGVYLYKVYAEKNAPDGKKDKADETGKLVILR